MSRLRSTDQAMGLAMVFVPSPAWKAPAGARGLHGFLARRELCALMLAGGIIAAAPLPAIRQAPSEAQARQLIQQAGNRMMAVLNEAGEWPAKERKLELLIAEYLDVSGIARFALGRFWNKASSAQREEFIRLFPILLLGELGRAVGVLQGITFTIDRSVPHESWVEVWTTVNRPRLGTRQVDWLVGLPDGKLRIIDIYAEGSSLRITQRDDVVSFMAQHQYSMEQLLNTLQRKIAEG